MSVINIGYSYLRQCLPNQSIDRLKTLRATTFLRRWLLKRRAIQLKAKKAAAIAKHGSFDATELIQVLGMHGIQSGDILFVQSSYNDLFTFSGSPMELLSALRSIVGITGTLLMPAFTTNSWAKPPRLFDPASEPTYTGLVNEIFRRSPGVIRSLHPRHSICGQGPLATQLLADHEKCIRADGPSSPFDRMRLLPNAKILTLGLAPGYLSFLHWVEDYDLEKLPFPLHKPEPNIIPIKLPNGSVQEILDYPLNPTIAATLSLNRIVKHLSSAAIRLIEHKGVLLGIYPMMPLSEELLALRDRGIIHYR